MYEFVLKTHFAWTTKLDFLIFRKQEAIQT